MESYSTDFWTLDTFYSRPEPEEDAMAQAKIAKKPPKLEHRFEDEDDDLIGGESDVPAASRMVKRTDNEPTAAARLRSFIQRIERLEEDKAAVAADIKDVYAEVKSTGFDVKVVRAIIARRKKEPEKVREFEELLELYLAQLGYE